MMNQVAGSLAPGAGFGFQNPSQAYYYGGGPSSASSQAASHQQAFAPAPHAGYHDGGKGAASMDANVGTMMPARFGQQQYPYTTAPYTQSVSAQAPAPQPPQQQQPNVRQSPSASPHPRQSPNATSQQQAQQTQSLPNQYPMAAPPLPQSPANTHQTASSDAALSPRSPQTPGSQSREQQRVTLLLDINTELFQEVNKLQAEGKGGALNPQQLAQMQEKGQQIELASDEYLQVLRRVQANLAYLMPKAQHDQQKAPKGPAHMTPPPHMSQLEPKYQVLQELFPDWQGYDRRPSGTSGSPQPNGLYAGQGMAA